MSPPLSPNFAFLAHHDGRLAIFGTQAERYFADDPNTCLIKLRNRLHERGALDVRTKQLLGGPGQCLLRLIVPGAATGIAR